MFKVKWLVGVLVVGMVSWGLSSESRAGQYTTDSNTVLLLHMETDGMAADPLDPPPFSNVDWHRTADASGLGNHASVVWGDAYNWWKPGRYGNSWKIETPGMMIVPDRGDSLQVLDEITIESWVKLDSYQVVYWNPVVLRTSHFPFWGATPGTAQYALIIGGQNTTPGAVFFQINVNEVWNPLVNYGVQVPLNKWTHVAGTWDGTTQRIYMNGVKIAERSYPGTMTIASSADPNLTGGVFIAGNHTMGGPPDGFLAGSIDEVRISDVARTANEIAIGADVPSLANAGDDQTAYTEANDTAGDAVVTLNGSASGVGLIYAWTATGAGSTSDIANPNQAITTANFPVGVTTATLTVTDDLSRSSSDNAVITVVDDTPPVVTITHPINGSTIPSATIPVSGTVVDNVDVITSVDVSISSSVFPVVGGNFGGILVQPKEAFDITAVAVDSAGNIGEDTATVIKVHDMRK